MDNIFVGIDPGAGKRTGIAVYDQTHKAWVMDMTKECHQDTAKAILTRLIFLSRVHACWTPETSSIIKKALIPLYQEVQQVVYGFFSSFGVSDSENFLFEAHKFHGVLGMFSNQETRQVLERALLREPQITLVIRVEDTASNQQLHEHRMQPVKELLELMTLKGLGQVYDGQQGLPSVPKIEMYGIALPILSRQINGAVRYLNRIANNVGMNGQISRDIQQHLNTLHAEFEPILPSDPPLNSEEMEVLTGLKTKKSHAHIRSAANLISDVVEHDVSDRYFGTTKTEHPRAAQIKRAMMKGIINQQAKERRKRERA